MKTLRNDKGSALVEFTIVLPAFLFVVLGSITFLWVLGTRSAVTGAARDGARYASIPHDWLDSADSGPCNTDYPSQSEIESYVKSRAGAFGVDSVTVTPTSVPYRNEVITVTATRDLPSLFGTIASFVGIKHISYTSTAVARSE